MPTRIRQIVPLVLLAALAAAGSAPAQPPASSPPTLLTLDDALARLRTSNESLQAAAAEVRQLEEERGAARGMYWPRVDIHARATHLDDAVVLDLDPIRQVINTLHRLPDTMLPPFEATFQEQDFWTAQITATWPIFTGGKVRAANRAAGFHVEDATHRQAATEHTLATELTRRYFALRLALKARDVKAGAVDSLTRHAFEATRLEEEGLIARVERLHAEVARARAVRDLQAADHDVALARSALSSLLSTPDSVEPSTELFLIRDIGPLETFVATALREHPGLKRLVTHHSLAGEALTAARGRWMPDVALFGMRELHPDGLSIVDPTWAVGVGATWTLFDGFDREHRIAAARSQQERVDLLTARARRDIGTLVEQKYRTAAKARDQFVSLDTTMALAEEVVRVRSRAFDEGFSTSVEVVDAQLTLQGVRLQRLLAAYEFDVALAELVEATGDPARYSDLRQRADLYPER